MPASPRTSPGGLGDPALRGAARSAEESADPPPDGSASGHRPAAATGPRPGGAAPPTTGTPPDAAQPARHFSDARAAPDAGRGNDPAPPCPDDERLARAALTRLAEPGDELVGAWVGELGAAEVLRRIAGGGALPRARGPRPENYRVRLTGVHPAADLDRIRSIGGRLVCPGDAEWPSQLDDLGPARPLCLWLLGTPSLRLHALRSVAVVGARACTEYGAHAATELAAELARAGWVVVSGAAYGIDAAAHRGALAVSGATIGVLACGVDTVYPPGHAQLCRRIAEQGLLVSELPPGQHPNRTRFVLRNRVIAALTRGTVVVEAALRSGALSTARRAEALNRHVMGVPGSCFSELSTGVHALIRAGATLVTDASEVIDLVGGIGSDLAPQRHGAVVPRDLLAPEAAQVLDALPPGDCGAPVEAVAREAGLPVDRVLHRLYELGALGFVQRRGEHWRLTPRTGDR